MNEIKVLLCDKTLYSQSCHYTSLPASQSSLMGPLHVRVSPRGLMSVPFSLLVNSSVPIASVGILKCVYLTDFKTKSWFLPRGPKEVAANLTKHFEKVWDIQKGGTTQ